MSDLDVGLRLILAILLGGVIGLEREWADKPAGLRTNILVSLGTALFVVIAFKLVDDYPQMAGETTRIAAGVITGIGFLGAGTILRTEKDVQGLTTAATIWLVCGIGMAAGVGYYALASVSAVLGLAVLRLMDALPGRIRNKGNIIPPSS
jgi:putative Mg2+ transporter-C (MgtC) family protein